MKVSKAQILCVVAICVTQAQLCHAFWPFKTKSYQFSYGTVEINRKLDKLRYECFVTKVKTRKDLDLYVSQYIGFIDSVKNSSIPAKDKQYLTAAIDFDLFSIYYDWYKNVARIKKEEQAYKRILSAESNIDSLIKNKVKNSQILCLKGEICMRKVVFVGISGGGMAALDLFNKGKYYLDESLKYDKNNPRANLVLGTYYMFAPKIAGGSANVAMKLYRRAREYGTGYEKFMSYVWSGVAYYTYLNDTGKGLQEINAGYQMAPNHPWLNEIAEKMKNKKPVLNRNF